MIPNSFEVILPKVSSNFFEKWADGMLTVGHFFKNTQVSETQEFRKSFSRIVSNTTFNTTLVVELFCYRGNNADPEWIDVDTSQSLPNINLSAY